MLFIEFTYEMEFFNEKYRFDQRKGSIGFNKIGFTYYG